LRLYKWFMSAFVVVSLFFIEKVLCVVILERKIFFRLKKVFTLQ
jgi:hypothetical protein